MRKYILSLMMLQLCLSAWSQKDSLLAPYQKFPFYPPVKLLLPDSASYYTKDDLPKKTAIMLMLFNPECEHCQHETQEIIKNIDQFKEIQIVMATSQPFDSMMAFRERYKLADYKNIVVAQDTHFFLISYFMIHSLPFLAFFNKKKELISVFEGTMHIDKALEELKK